MKVKEIAVISTTDFDIFGFEINKALRLGFQPSHDVQVIALGMTPLYTITFHLTEPA